MIMRKVERKPKETAHLDQRAAEIMRRAVAELTALLPEYVAVDPVRGLRVATVVSESGRDLLREFGLDDDSGTPGKLGKFKNGGPTFGPGVDGMMDAAAGQAVATTISSLLGAITAAEAAGETDLAADLRWSLKKARASLTEFFGTEEDQETPEASDSSESPDALGYYTPPGGDEIPLAPLPNPAT